jgi:arylsulfatase A-like enzyme
LSAVPNVDAVTLAGSFADWYRGRRLSDAASTPKPFFAWVHFIDPHQPYTPSQEHDLFHGPRPDQEALDSRWRAALPRVAELSPAIKPRAFDEAASEMVRQSGLYDGEVRSVDDGVGRILEALKAGGELDSTLVIFCGDHGEMLFEHTIQPFLLEERLQRNGGLPGGVQELFGNGHRPWYFEDLWNTPLILAGPGVPAGARRDGLAANLDIYPTILDALDLPRPAWLEGQSLWGGLVPQRERVFAHGQLTSAVRERSGVKLIVHSRRLYMLEGDGPPPVELYDVSSDPMEERDLAQTRTEDVARLSGEIERWRKANDRAATTDTTPEQARALRQMGYAGGDPAAPVPTNGGVKRR